MDDAKDAEFARKLEDEVEDDDPESDSNYDLESLSRSETPDLEFVGEFAPFEDLSRKVVENYKSNLPRRSGSDRQRKFFKGKASKVVPEDSVDVDKVLKLISDKSVHVETVKSNFKTELKTYGNRRKSSLGLGHSVESFGLPDDPIITSTVSNDSSSICIDLQDDNEDNWILDDFKIEKLEVKDEPDNRVACGVFNPYYRESYRKKKEYCPCPPFSTEQSFTTASRVQNSVNSIPMPSSQISKMIKIDYKPSPVKPVIQHVEVLNIRPQPASNVIDVPPVKPEIKSLQSVKLQSEIITPKLIVDVESPVKLKHDDSLTLNSSKCESADVTIQLYSTNKKHGSLTPLVEIKPVERKSGGDVPVATKPDLEVLETPLQKRKSRNVIIDDDVIEVVDLVENDSSPKKEQSQSKIVRNKSPVRPNVTVEIEPEKTSLQAVKINNIIKPVLSDAYASSSSDVKSQKLEAPDLAIELDPSKVSEQLEKVDLTEELSKPSLNTPVKSDESPKRGIAETKTELEMSQIETESAAKELEVSIQSSVKKDPTGSMSELKTQEHKIAIDLELDTVDLVDDQLTKSEVVKAGHLQTKSRRSRLAKSQQKVVAPKGSSDMKSPVKIEHADKPEVTLRESTSSTAAAELTTSTPLNSKRKNRCSEQTFNISSESPITVKSDAVESRRLRSVKSQSEFVAPKREVDTKPSLKEEHADASGVTLRKPESDATVESPSTTISSEKKSLSTELVVDIPPESPVIVKSDVVEARSRRSRSVKPQPESVAPERGADMKSPLKEEHADTSEVALRKSKSEATVESPSAIRRSDKKSRNAELVLDIPPESSVIVISDTVETKSRRSRSVKSQPELVDIKSPLKNEQPSEVKSQVLSPATRSPKKKNRNSEQQQQQQQESSVIVKTDTVETRSRRSHLVRCQPEFVAPKHPADTKSPVKKERVGTPVESPSTVRSTKEESRDTQPVIDITSESDVVKTDAVETKSRRSRLVKSQPESKNVDTKSPVKRERAETPVVTLRETKSSESTLESSSTVIDISSESDVAVKTDPVETKSRRSRLAKSRPESIAPSDADTKSPVKNEKEKSLNTEPVVDIPPESVVIVKTDAVETKSRRSRLVKSQPESKNVHTKSPVKNERADTPVVTLRETKSTESTVESPSTVRSAKEKSRDTEVIDISSESDATVKVDLVEIKSRRSRLAKSQPESIAPSHGVDPKSPMKKEKEKSLNTKPVLDIPAESVATVKTDTVSRRSRSGKSLPGFIVPSRTNSKSPVKKDRADTPVKTLRETKPSESTVESPTTVRSTEEKSRNTDPVVDTLPESAAIPKTDTAITQSRRSRSMKSPPGIVVPSLVTKSPVKKQKDKSLNTEPVVDISPESPVIVEIDTVVTQSRSRSMKSPPGASADTKSLAQGEIADKPDAKPQESKTSEVAIESAGSDCPNTTKQNKTGETVEPVAKKQKNRNVRKFDDDVIEVIDLIEDCDNQKIPFRRSKVINKPSVPKRVITKPVKRMKKRFVQENSNSKVIQRKNRVPKDSTDFAKLDARKETEPIEIIDLDDIDLDNVCLSDRVKNTNLEKATEPQTVKNTNVEKATEPQTKEPASKPVEQETSKVEGENGMRLSVRLEKLNDKVMLSLSPPVKRSRGRPRLSELKQNSELSLNSDNNSSILNESMRSDEGSDLLSSQIDDEKNESQQEQIPVKRGRGRPRKLTRETNRSIVSPIKSQDDLSTKNQSNIVDAGNSCSDNALESKCEEVQKKQSPLKQPSTPPKLSTEQNKSHENELAVEPQQSLPSPDKSDKEKRKSGTFSAWKIRLKNVESESSKLTQECVLVDDLPLSIWYDSDNVDASANDDSMKKSKRRSKHKKSHKRKTESLSDSERYFSTEVSKKPRRTAESGLAESPLKTEVEPQQLNAQKESNEKRDLNIPFVNQDYVETLRLDDKNVTRNSTDHLIETTKKISRKRINPLHIKREMMMEKKLMVILKPLNETQLEQSTPKKELLQRSDAKTLTDDSPVTKELVPNPVNATQRRNKKKFIKKYSPEGKFQGLTKEQVLPTEAADFQVGDIAWAKLGSFPFWPCMITRDPNTDCYKKKFAKFPMQYHVRFFGDNGQRAWVRKHCIMIYRERDDLEKLARQLQNKMSRVKQNTGLMINVLSSKMSSKWHSGVDEAESLRVKSLEERLAYVFVPLKKKKSVVTVDKRETPLAKGETSLKGDSLQDEDKGTRKRRISAEYVPAKRPRIKSPEKQLDDRIVKEAPAASEEPVENQTPEKPAMKTRSSRGALRESFTRSTDNLMKEPCAPNSSIARNKHLVIEGSNASDTDSKLSDISSVPTSLESQAALFKRNYLFRGVSKDKVCQICEKPGEVMMCRGPCSGMYHYDCVADVSATQDPATEDTEDDDEDSDMELAPSDAKVEILTVLSTGENSVVDLVPTPGLNAMTLAEKIDYRMRQVMKKFDYGASYTNATATDPGEEYVLEVASFQTAKENGDEKKSTSSSPLKSPKKTPKNTMEIIKHVTADNVSYKCVNKKEERKKKKKSKPAGVVVNPCISTEFKCKWCKNGVLPACHACNQQTDKDGSAFRQRCSLPKCGKYYHPECLKIWPQTQWSIIDTTQEENETYSTFVCPSHVCHTCFSEDPRPGMHHCITKAAKCLRCPATYHSLNHCVPAGTQLLSSSQIVCPRHYVSQPHPCNANWCFICSKGGDLICCERCPTSVHAECMPAGPEDPAAADIYYCEDCQSGRLPLYDEIVWVKMGKFRWWPAVILFPNEVPESVRKSKHETGEFVAKFFGTYNHFWVHRGNVFLFQEGDKGGSGSSRSGLDTNFNKAIEEAAIAHQLKRQFKINHLAGKRSHLKPPPYIKIKSNRPLGNVRMVDHNTSNTTSCECDPSQPHPCGPDSDCLNRLLLTECDPEVCPAGERCNNQCFEKREYPPLAPYKTESRGWGLKTLAPLRKGQFVIEYVGEVLDMEEYRRRVKKMHERKEENYYFLTIDNMRMLDAGPKGNLARFMNHSCQPNCETQKWTVNSDTRVGLFAKMDIPVDTELTFNYNLECIGKEKKECNCGAEKCSGFIGVKVKGEEKVSRKKKLRKKKIIEIPNVIPNPCFQCKKIDGEVGACNNKICTKFYHLKCVGLTSWPKGDKWVCSWHNCSFCLKRTIRCCVECTNSYCPPHAEGNVRYDKLLGFICREHDPLNKQSKGKIQQVTVFNGKKKVKEEKFATPDLAMLPRRRALQTSDKKKEHDSSGILHFDENIVTSTPLKRPRDESTCSEESRGSTGGNPQKKRKTEASSSNASLATSVVTTRRRARELNQTVPKCDLSSVKKRLTIKHENTL